MEFEPLKKVHESEINKFCLKIDSEWIHNKTYLKKCILNYREDSNPKKLYFLIKQNNNIVLHHPVDINNRGGYNRIALCSDTIRTQYTSFFNFTYISTFVSFSPLSTGGIV